MSCRRTIAGPLWAFKIIEIAGVGPVSFCGMMLGDMGAEVVRVERQSARDDEPKPIDPLIRNRRSIALDLKNPAGVAVLLRLIDRADAVIEGFRPGVAERLGWGPDVCLRRNPRLIYGRATGWGQDGPLAHCAAHDINYLALAGALGLIGPIAGKPVPPLNLVGDCGTGLLLAFGVVCALAEVARTGRGQVVDAAIVDSVIAFLSSCFDLHARGWATTEAGESVVGGAAPFYGTYETADRKYLSIGPIEPRFYELLLEKLGLNVPQFDLPEDGRYDAVRMRERWRALRIEFADIFRQHTRAEWDAILGGTDVCYAPVLTIPEAALHPHNRHRRNFASVNGVLQSAPAPRFSGTPAASPGAPRAAGADTLAVLQDWGFDDSELAELRTKNALT